MAANPKFIEVDLNRQGRPSDNEFQGLDSLTTGIPSSYIRGVVLQILEEEMKEELIRITNELAKANAELKVIKLHLASMSNAEVEDAE